MGLCGISVPFGTLSPTLGKVSYVLLTRTPRYWGRIPFAFDLHVLSPPLTFALSQDQTLQLNFSTTHRGEGLTVERPELRPLWGVMSSLLAITLFALWHREVPLGRLSPSTGTRDYGLSDSVFKDRPRSAGPVRLAESRTLVKRCASFQRALLPIGSGDVRRRFRLRALRRGARFLLDFGRESRTFFRLASDSVLVVIRRGGPVRGGAI